VSVLSFLYDLIPSLRIDYEAIFTQHLQAAVNSQKNNPTNEQDLLPHQLLMIADEPGMGNMHFIQKTFEGAFEVCSNQYCRANQTDRKVV
jgi:hypothetical protein